MCGDSVGVVNLVNLVNLVCPTVVVTLFLLRMAQSRLEVDFSELKSLAAKELAEQYQVSALFNVHSTSTFKLKMNASTMEVFSYRYIV